MGTLLNQALIDIELLFDKRLYIFCSDYVDYYLELAQETESYTFILQLIRWKRKCIIRSGNPVKLKEFSEEEYRIEQDCLRKMNINAEIRHLQQKMLALINQKGNSMHRQEKDMMMEIINHPMVREMPNNVSILS